MSLITADSIKAVIASYWRYVRQCPVIALEVSSNLSSYPGVEIYRNAKPLAGKKLTYLQVLRIIFNQSSTCAVSPKRSRRWPR